MTLKRVKELLEKYPFLRTHESNFDEISEEDEDYSYLLGLEIPQGWYRLFLQMCEDIKQPLISANCLNDFRFLQVKEKYNMMRCYHNGAPEEVESILRKYEMMARYVCTICGRPAEYETSGYIASFCNDCWKDFARHEKGEFIKFHPYYEVSTYENGVSCKEKISFENEWNRYLKRIG